MMGSHEDTKTRRYEGWDWKPFNFDSDVVRGDLPESLVMNATDPNMQPFFKGGGKLLLYHGWSDTNVPAVNTIKYYERVLENLGGPAKAVIQAFYGNGPKLSYWNGCSTGGRQGLKEAQMFPEDYDGIIAGAPANRTAISLWIAHAVLKDPASYIPPANGGRSPCRAPLELSPTYRRSVRSDARRPFFFRNAFRRSHCRW